MEMILTENPQNAIIPLPYFMNLLRHRFSTVNYELYELFSNCGFITSVMQMDLSAPVIASEGIVAWIKANFRLGRMKVKKNDRKLYEYVRILDEAAYGGVDMRIQRESAVRLRAQGDFVQCSMHNIKQNPLRWRGSTINGIMVYGMKTRPFPPPPAEWLSNIP